MKSIGNNNFFIEQQKEHKLKPYKKITLFRRYWDTPNNEYTWETTASIDIDKDVIRCGRITWKADTDELNVWKMGNITITMDNSHGKWYTNNTDGYFWGYMPFLSMIRIEVGFEAEDGTIHNAFTYQGLLTKDGIQVDNEKHQALIKVISLDYLIEQVNAEDVSRRPIDPVLQYDNADIFSATTIGKTGSGWTVNAYQYLIVRIISGTGLGQERKILSNTADTLTVNAWATTPDATSDFEILGEHLGDGNAIDTEFTTTQPGVGKILKVWIDDTLKYQGEQYDVSQLNESALGAKVTFTSPPAAGTRIIADYIYWYQNQTFKFLIEKILDLAGVTNRYVQDVTFPEKLGVGVAIDWTQTSQADWNAGTQNQADLTRYPGDIIADDDESTDVRDYYSDIDYDYDFLDEIGELGSAQLGHRFKAYKSAFISKFEVRLNKAGDTGWISARLYTDSGGSPGTYVASNTNGPVYLYGFSSGAWVTFTFASYRMTYGSNYWLVLYKSAGASTISVYRGDQGSSDQHMATWTGSAWDHHSNDRHFFYRYYYHPFYADFTHMSQTLDAGASFTSYGKLETFETLNGGTATYYTKSNSVDSFPATFIEAEWDQVDAFGNITSSDQRYLRVAVKGVPQYPGRTGPTTSDMNTPHIESYTVTYYTTEYEPTVANFTGLNGKQAIETIAKLANYEMGFFTDYNSNDNMTWDVDYDGSVLPTAASPSWTLTELYGKGTVSSGVLTIEKDDDLVNSALRGLAVKDGKLYGTGYLSYFFRYDDIGDTWTQIADEIPGTNLQSLINFNNNLYAVDQNMGLRRYNFGTNSWDIVAAAYGGSPAPINALAEANGKLYGLVWGAGTNNCHLVEWDGVSAWVQKAAGFGGESGFVLFEFMDKIYAGTDGTGLLLEWDGVSAWVQKAAQFGSETRIYSLALYNGKLYGTSSPNAKLLEWDGVSAWVQKATALGAETAIGGLVVFNGQLYGGTWGGGNNGQLYRWDDVSAWVQETTTSIGGNVLKQITFDTEHPYDGKITTITFSNNGYRVWQWQIGEDWQEFIRGSAFYAYYHRTETTLSAREGWTIEMRAKRDLDSDINTVEDEGGVGIRVRDGTYETTVIVTHHGKGYLKDYIEGSTVNKSFDVPEGDYITLKVERKLNQIYIYVNNSLVLTSYGDKKTSTQTMEFGQFSTDYASVQNRIDYVRYKIGTVSGDTFYLPQYYFQARSYASTGLELRPDQNYIKLYALKNGWDKIYNHIVAEYGEYSYEANAFTELDDHPHSEDAYGIRSLTISGGDFLQATDTNVAVGVGSRYYGYYKNPRIRFKLFCRFLLQLNLSDAITVYCDEPFAINGMNVKIVGIVLDIDRFTLDLDCEEII